MNLNTGAGGGAEAEVEAGIVCGEITGLAHDLLGLNVIAVADKDSGADGATIAFGSFQAHFEPVVARRSVIAQE